MNSTTAPVLVIGATGKTGRRVTRRLAAHDIPVRAGSRSAVPRFDWEDPTTWKPAVAGARAMSIAYAPDLAVPGAADAVSELARLAVAEGITRIVLLSGRGEPAAQAAEQAVQAVAPTATIVRCSWFAQNFSEDYLLDAVLDGEVALPAGHIPEPFVDADDIADVTAAALQDDRHAGQVYELTGPRALTFAQAVGEIAAAAGREIAYVPISLDDFAAGARAQGVPEPVVEMLAYLFGEVLDGRNTPVADGVQRALGRPARDFSAYARHTAATGVWNP